MEEDIAIKKNGNIIPEFNHLKNLIFLLIILAIYFMGSYPQLNKFIRSVNY